MQAECCTTLFDFAPVGDRKIVASFDGGRDDVQRRGVAVGETGRSG